MTRLLRMGGLWVILLMAGLTAHAQRENRLGPPIAMSISPAMVNGDYVKIPYEIPYDGYIIFNLFSPEGEKLWEYSAVKLKGTQVLNMKRTPLKPGVQYNYEFWYKGKKYLGKFTN